MFDLFGIKKLKMTIEELRQENEGLLGALTRANESNRELNQSIKDANQTLDIASKRISYLEGQLKMKEAQKIASEKYSDTNRNY
jgi:septal ring factor EnvC (AmiA/AmiB activator)